MKIAQIVICLILIRQVSAESQEPERREALSLKFRAWIDSAVSRSRGDSCYALVVNKARRQMEVYLAGDRVARFPVAIGHTDADTLTDRQRAGDHHLKEGIFHLCQVAWDKGIPNWDYVWMRMHTVESAKQDYVEVYGEEGRRQLDLWERRHGPMRTDGDVRAFNGRYPERQIWRGLGIHGGGTGRDWTFGCIALDRENVRWLYILLKNMQDQGVGTPIAVVRF